MNAALQALFAVALEQMAVSPQLPCGNRPCARCRLAMLLSDARKMSGDDAYVFIWRERKRGETTARKTAAQLRELLTVAPAAAKMPTGRIAFHYPASEDDSGDSDSSKRAAETPAAVGDALG